jgi:hypothetical protein
MSTRKVVHAATLVLLSVLVLMSGRARGDLTPCLNNAQFTCPSPSNQFTVVYVSNTIINIEQIYVGTSDNPSLTPTLSFEPGDLPGHTGTNGDFVMVSPNGTLTDTNSSDPNVSQYIQVSGNQTDRVTITFTVVPDTSLGGSYSTNLFPQGYGTHVGIRGDGSVRVADSYWSNGGTAANSSDGHLPGVNFSGTSIDWLVTRVSIYDSSGNVIGQEWEEQQAASFSLTGSNVPLYVSYATLLSPTQIPLEDLNNSLTGFGSESPVVRLAAAAVPEPSGLVIASIGILGMLGYAWSRRGAKKT